MADNDLGPVWARRRRRRGGGGAFVGFIVTLFAIFGALCAGMGVKERSLEGGGAVIDGWIATGWAWAKEAAGRAPETAREAAAKAGAAAEKAGDAVQSGVDETADELKTR